MATLPSSSRRPCAVTRVSERHNAAVVADTPGQGVCQASLQTPRKRRNAQAQSAGDTTCVVYSMLRRARRSGPAQERDAHTGSWQPC